MTATFATLGALGRRETTPDERNARPARSQTRRRAVVVALALFAGACGGISERHDTTDAGADAQPNSGAEPGKTTAQNPDTEPPASADTPSATEETNCESICGVCLATTASQGCASFCGSVITQASDAKCSSALASVLGCRKKASDPCATAACPTEDNALTACVIDYCDSHFMADVCVAPI